MTRAELNRAKARMKQARENGNMKEWELWNTVIGLSKRRSTKGWTLAQLIERVQTVQASFASFEVIS